MAALVTSDLLVRLYHNKNEEIDEIPSRSARNLEWASLISFAVSGDKGTKAEPQVKGFTFSQYSSKYLIFPKHKLLSDDNNFSYVSSMRRL